jgi:hypothetical protein
MTGHPAGIPVLAPMNFPVQVCVVASVVAEQFVTARTAAEDCPGATCAGWNAKESTTIPPAQTTPGADAGDTAPGEVLAAATPPAANNNPVEMATVVTVFGMAVQILRNMLFLSLL